MLPFCLLNGYAVPSLLISTSKQVYEYGDFLSINFQVSELTGNQIILHIVDSSGKVSAPIDIPINKINNTITAPIPFYKTTFNPGTYHIDAEYSGAKTRVSFVLIDSEKIAIPNEFKTLVKTLRMGTINETSYASIIRELMNLDIIKIPNYQYSVNTIHIPHWFTNDANWWADDLISDNEFGHVIQYLIQKEILVV
jgi:hypothetical protein